MGFEKGHKRYGGRQAGTKNKNTIAIQERAKELKLDAVGMLIWSCDEAKKQYEYYRDKVQEGRYSPMEDQSAKFLNIYCHNVKEIMSYLYSKPKSEDEQKAIKVTVDNYLAEKK